MADEAYQDYWRALGQMIHEFSVVELLLNTIPSRMARLMPSISQAVLSGSTRADAACKLIKRVIEAKGQADAEMDYVCSQVAALNTMRTHIVHCGAHHDGETFVASNWMAAHHSRNRKTDNVQTRMLEAMITDLRKVQHHLIARIHTHIRSDPQVHAVLAAPWQYKSPQPVPEAVRSNP